MLDVSIHLNKTSFQLLFKRSVVICFAILLCFFNEPSLVECVFESILLLNDLGQHGFDVTADLSTELAVSIANAKQMQTWKACQVGSQNVLVLVDFVGVVRMVTYSGSKCKLTYAILALSVVGFHCLLLFFPTGVHR